MRTLDFEPEDNMIENKNLKGRQQKQSYGK